MVKLQDKLKFRDDFPPVSTEEWEEKIHRDLKGADYRKKLIWRTLEGFEIRPYYRKEDLQNIKHLAAGPAEYPYVRSKKEDSNDWFVRQNIDARTDQKGANEKALEVLNRGVDSLGFLIDENNEPGKKEFDQLLNDICISAIELNFEADHASHTIVDLLLQKINSDNLNKDEIRGGVNFNPIGHLNLRGKFCKSADYSFDRCKELIEKAKDLPEYHVLEIDGASLHNAAATNVQELGFALAMGNEYLANLTEKGLSVDDIAQKMRLKLGVGSSYFLEIAKFRAARMLWAKMIEAYNPSEEKSKKLQIHAETSEWNQTIYDPYVNMLRGTTEAMAAVLGGTDSLMVTPYDQPFEKPADFAKRISRNTQIILKEEAYFDRVVDPGAGSYYIENLTKSIAEHAWKLFQEIENEGGYIEAFKNGKIQERIKESANKRNQNIAAKKEAVLGINLYPNANEKMEKGYNESTIQATSQKADGAIAEPIQPYRGAEEMETLRFKTDKNPKGAPKVFMFTIGDAKMRRARAQFSSSFFAAGGFDIIDNIGFDTVDEGVKEAKDKDADIVVICSSDAEYPELAPEINEKMKDHAIVVLAGYPKDSVEELKEKGIKHFIHLKSNLVETLSGFQKELGIV